MKKAFIFMIDVYQTFLSGKGGLLTIVGLKKPHSCVFYPVCSVYAKEAVERHGPWKGLILAVKRIGSCHPWQEPQIDPVPPAKE